MNEFLHASELAPLVILAALRWIDRRRVPGQWWLVAAAFAMSWVGDSIAYYDGGTFRGSYFWLPAQAWLALVAFPPRWLPVAAWGIALAVTLPMISVVSARLSWPGPEWLVTISAAMAVLMAVSGPLRVPVWIYWAGGSVAYLRMIGLIGLPGFSVARSQYHDIALIAYASFAAVALWQGRIKWRDT